MPDEDEGNVIDLWPYMEDRMIDLAFENKRRLSEQRPASISRGDTKLTAEDDIRKEIEDQD